MDKFYQDKIRGLQDELARMGEETKRIKALTRKFLSPIQFQDVFPLKKGRSGGDETEASKSEDNTERENLIR